ncbi:Nodal modulator 1 [Cryptotermes secundus]|uniref:Nodal modulator 1 n=2 Tax=Cryptotermes secundus TaxID=105785 RepID=A0A2J7QKR9_9NEOP|nr:nodal modulator 1 [Cryptotermes secundus]PNF29184.1 Nodal modulator 1 [Cryptotermes secundus]
MYYVLKILLFFIALTCLIFCDAEDILGCGGFVKSDIDINFSQVEVKLYTKQGSLKDHTDCAPNNGYYFLPLYDKGEYVLKIEPPAGWSFEPKEVILNVDGRTDQCSQGKDINFVFKGFAITGRVVSSGRQVGPKGVKVTLFPDGQREFSPIQDTLTSENGDFHFTPVLPGKYFIKASHPTWKLSNNSVVIQLMKERANIPSSSLVVAGYDVSGLVTSDNEPIRGVSFVLFQAEESPPLAEIQGCEKNPLKGFKISGSSPLCHVISDEKGQFTFPSIPPGSYKVVPHYEGPHGIKFDVRPVEIHFTVEHGSFKIDTEFKVKGFSVSGRVLLRTGGKGIVGAVVLLNGKTSSVTRADGSYHLENLQAGSYVLQVQAHDMKFPEMNVKITPNTPQLTDIFPSSFKVCGVVSPYKLISGSTENGLSSVVLSKEGGSTEPIIAEARAETGEFCVFLEPGKYEGRVKVSEDEKMRGLQFFPAVHVIEVVDSPILSGIEFAQLKVKLAGHISCLAGDGNCDEIPVHLQALLGNNNEARPVTTTISKGGSYTFEDILPGRYQVSVHKDEWCWESSAQTVSVGTAVSTVPPFRQVGYTVTFMSSHDTQVQYKLQTPGNSPATTGSLNVKRGTMKSCVSEAGTYEFVPIGCHGYAQPSVKWNSATAATSSVRLTAVAHTLGGRVLTTENVKDVFINVLSGEDGKLKARLGPLSPKPSSGGMLEYNFKLMAAEGEKLVLEPTAGTLLFSPPRSVLVGANNCVSTAVELHAEKGHLVEGQVIPPSAGIKVTITKGSSSEVVVVTETAEDGKFKIGPLQGGVDYRVKAEKEGFVLTGPDAKGNFNAHKLAEVIVEVLDKADGKPLQGVLLSLSGGESFRRNSQTGTDGKMTFSSLSPSEYFLRPMMKEYRFEPHSKMITVEEGATVNVQLNGHRVAYSTYGMVTSLNGEPEDGIVVEAIGQEKCSHFQEESSSESNGQFRIRGLHPECIYVVRVKEGPEINQHIQRSTPVGIPVKAADGDVTDLRLVVFHPITQMDLTVHVQTTNPEHLRTLRAKLCREDSPDSPVHIVKLDSPNGKSPSSKGTNAAMLVFPSLPADGRGYFLQLESTLSHSTHSYTTHAVHFKANSSFRLVKLSFKPEPKVLEHELVHSSYFALPLIIMAVVIYFNHVKILPFLNWIVQSLSSSLTTGVNTSRAINTTSDHAAVDAVMVEPIINVTKRKLKPRKT